MDEPRLLASAFKSDVLADIHAVTTKFELAQFSHEGLDNMGPSIPVHGVGANVDFGRRLRIGGYAAWPIAAMVVTMNVEYDKTSIILLKLT